MSQKKHCLHRYYSTALKAKATDTNAATSEADAVLIVPLAWSEVESAALDPLEVASLDGVLVSLKAEALLVLLVPELDFMPLHVGCSTEHSSVSTAMHTIN